MNIDLGKLTEIADRIDECAMFSTAEEIRAIVLRASEAARATLHPEQIADLAARCALPPAGWRCIRPAGHEGPCAAIEETPALHPEQIADLAARCGVKGSAAALAEFAALVREAEPMAPGDMRPAPVVAEAEEVIEGAEPVASVAKEAPAVPEGFILMPKKLTPEMTDVLEFGRTQPAHNTYLNLLAAAPQAPATQEAEIGSVQAARFYMDHGVWHDRVTGQHMWTQDQYDEAVRDARSAGPAISTAASQNSIIGAWNDALEEAALICDRVNNHDDPMTASDCADCIRELKSDLAPTTSTVSAPASAQVSQAAVDSRELCEVISFAISAYKKGIPAEKIFTTLPTDANGWLAKFIMDAIEHHRPDVQNLRTVSAPDEIRNAALEEAASVYMVGSVAAREIRKLKRTVSAPEEKPVPTLEDIMAREKARRAGLNSAFDTLRTTSTEGGAA